MAKFSFFFLKCNGRMKPAGKQGEPDIEDEYAFEKT